jgi:hypothetical protein
MNYYTRNRTLLEVMQVTASALHRVLGSSLMHMSEEWVKHHKNV